MNKMIAMVSLFVLQIGCASAERSQPVVVEPVPAESGGGLPFSVATLPDASWASCQADSDCIFVARGPCENAFCLSGEIAVVNASHRSDAERLLNPAETPAGTACPTIACPAPQLGCDQGQCRVRAARAPEGETAPAAATGCAAHSTSDCPQPECRLLTVTCQDQAHNCRYEAPLRCQESNIVGPPGVVCSTEPSTGNPCVSMEAEGFPDGSNCSDGSGIAQLPTCR